MVLDRPMASVMYTIAYFIVGVIYSVFIRWPLYLNGLRRLLAAAKVKVLNQYNLPIVNKIESDSKAFKDWGYDVETIGRSSGLRLKDTGEIVPPQYHDNKARLLTWAILWPWNIFWVLVRKPVVWIFEELLSLQIFKRICQAMSDRMFKDFNK
jgi:hypothetical protein